MKVDKDPLISIIMPVYNMENYIFECIKSITNQTYENWELIAIDDGSSDESANIINSFLDRRIRYFRKENEGVSSARNYGIARARGEYIAFVDPDDYCHPNKLSVQLSQMKTIGLSCCGTLMHYMNSKSKFFGTCGESALEKGVDISSGRLMPFALSSIMVKSEVFELVGGFDTSFKSAEDHELLSRIAQCNRIGTIMFRLGGYRIHSKSVSARDYVTQGILSSYVVHIRECEYLGISPKSIQEYSSEQLANRKKIRQIKSRHFFRMAGGRYISGEYFHAFVYLLRSTIANPRYTFERVIFRLLPAQEIELDSSETSIIR